MKGPLVELSREPAKTRQAIHAILRFPSPFQPGGKVERWAAAQVIKSLAELGCQGIRVKAGKSRVAGVGYLEADDGGDHHPEG